MGLSWTVGEVDKSVVGRDLKSCGIWKGHPNGTPFLPFTKVGTVSLSQTIGQLAN